MSMSAELAGRLREWRIPRTKHAYCARDAAFYALSIGYGADPTDPQELRFVDHTRPDFCVVPSFSLILGYPGFWLGQPEVGLDVGRILHIEQSIEIFGPLPASGQVTGETTVTGLFDLGEGKGAILKSQREVRDDEDNLLVTVRQLHMLRGYGGFGGEPVPARPQRSSASAQWSVETPSLPQQALLYRLNGDLNPIHADPETAARAGFGRPILHGMCSVGMSCRALLRSLCAEDPARLHFMSVQMTAPVFPGETLRHDIAADGSFSSTVIERGKTALDFGQVVIAPAACAADMVSSATIKSATP